MIKFLPYVLRSAWRNRTRSALTVLGVAVAVFIMTGLASLLESRVAGVAASSETVLVVSELDVY
jgi:cell division protein FtsX